MLFGTVQKNILLNSTKDRNMQQGPLPPLFLSLIVYQLMKINVISVVLCVACTLRGFPQPCCYVISSTGKWNTVNVDIEWCKKALLQCFKVQVISVGTYIPNVHNITVFLQSWTYCDNMYCPWLKKISVETETFYNSGATHHGSVLHSEQFWPTLSLKCTLELEKTLLARVCLYVKLYCSQESCAALSAALFPYRWQKGSSFESEWHNQSQRNYYDHNNVLSLAAIVSL